MKASNSKFAKKAAYGLLSVIVVIFIIALFTSEAIYNFFLYPINLLLCYVFIKLKTITLELSGGCFTVRKHHPLTFKKYINPFFELPYEKLLDYYFVKRFATSKLKIKVISKRQNNFFMNISLWGFSRIQKNQLKKSLGVAIVSKNNHMKSISDSVQTKTTPIAYPDRTASLQKRTFSS